MFRPPCRKAHAVKAVAGTLARFVGCKASTGAVEMNVLKRNVLTAALLSTVVMASAVWAQEGSVDGKDFLSGAGDAKLANLARQAASEGKHLVVTAPNYWQSKVAAKLHAGAANVDVQMKEGFFENV